MVPERRSERPLRRSHVCPAPLAVRSYPAMKHGASESVFIDSSTRSMTGYGSSLSSIQDTGAMPTANTPAVMDDGGLTVEHAAAQPGVSERTIHRRINQDKIQAPNMSAPEQRRSWWRRLWSG